MKIYMTAPAEPESARIHLEAEREIAEEKAKTGNVIPYLEGLRRVELARGKQGPYQVCVCGGPPCYGNPPHRVFTAEPGQAADPESVKLHLAAEQEVEKARNRGEAVTYLAGLRRALARLGR